MKITTKADSLVILLEGWERLWALKASLCLKAKEVANVVWNPYQPDLSGSIGIRAPGASLPFTFHAGSFRVKKGWEFRYLHLKEPGELIIRTNVKKYQTIRLSTDEQTAFEIREWFNAMQQQRNVA